MQNTSNSSGLLIVQLVQEPRILGEKDSSKGRISLPGSTSDECVGFIRRNLCLLFLVKDFSGSEGRSFPL